MTERISITFSIPSPASKHLDLTESLQRQCLSYQAAMLALKALPEQVLFLVSHIAINLNNHHDEHTIEFVLKGHSRLTGEWKTKTNTRVLFGFTPHITVEQLCARIHESILSTLKDIKQLIDGHEHEIRNMIKAME